MTDHNVGTPNDVGRKSSSISNYLNMHFKSRLLTNCARIVFCIAVCVVFSKYSFTNTALAWMTNERVVEAQNMFPIATCDFTADFEANSRTTFIVTPYNDVPDRLMNFLTAFQQLVELNANVFLVISASKNDTMFVTQAVSQLTCRSQQRIKMLFNESPRFSRGRNQNRGAMYVAKNFGSSFTVFFSDIDLAISLPFFERCANFATPSKRAYFPIVWAEKNRPVNSAIIPDKLNFEKDFQSLIESGEHRGYWIPYGYGMLCINVEDFLNLGGFPEYEAWGAEDNAIMRKVQKSKLKVVRSKDSGLVHLYHSSNCSELVKFVHPQQPDVLKNCLSAQTAKE